MLAGILVSEALKVTVALPLIFSKTILPLAVVASSVVDVAPAKGRTVIVAVYPVKFQGVEAPVLGLVLLIVNWKLNVVACGQTKL